MSEISVLKQFFLMYVETLGDASMQFGRITDRLNDISGDLVRVAADSGRSEPRDAAGTLNRAIDQVRSSLPLLQQSAEHIKRYAGSL